MLNANVISTQAATGFEYAVRFQTQPDAASVTFQCVDVREAADLRDALNKYALNAEFLTPRERLHVVNAPLSLRLEVAGDRSAGILPSSYLVELPELAIGTQTAFSERNVVRDRLLSLFADISGCDVLATYSDEQWGRWSHPVERVPVLTGRSLYERADAYATSEGLHTNGNWNDLDEARRRAWDALAEYLERSDLNKR